MSISEAADQHPHVAIWRQTLLPASETFIEAQASALTRWQPHFAGLRRIHPGLQVTAEFVASQHRLDLRPFRWARFRRFLRSSNVDIVHAHFVTDAIGLLPLLRGTRRPLVVTAHGHDVTIERDNAVAISTLRERTASVVAVSGFIADRLSDLGFPESKIRILPIGIAVPDVPALPRGLEATVLFVGRLVEKKGCDDLLRAVASLPADVAATVRIVGDGPDRPRLEELARDLGINAFFSGALDAQAVRAEMREATIFCGPSKTASNGDAEGFGMVFLEAAAHRLPIVAYRSGGTAESIADGVNGILCTESDVRALASALEALLRNPERRVGMGAAGRTRVERSFDVRDCTAALEAEYDRVLHRAAGTR